MSDLTREGEELVARWKRAGLALERAESEVTKAQCERSNSTNALGKWLLPSDAKDGEQFCVWHGDSLLSATKNGDHDALVSVRTRGKRWSDS